MQKTYVNISLHINMSFAKKKYKKFRRHQNKASVFSPINHF